MNKRLMELARQAGITFKPMMIEGVEYSYQHVDLNDYTEGVEDEAGCIKLFAELIVRECANVAADHEALDIYEEIREHFGVEK